MDTIQKVPVLSKDEERIVYCFQLLGDKTRYKIFKLLLYREQLCVSQIAQKLDISVSAVSQHFKFFEMIGLVDKERTGQKICYLLKVNDDLVDKLVSITEEN